MDTKEVIALRKAADEIWEIARRLEKDGHYLASEMVKNLATAAHDSARMSSLPPRLKK